MRKVPRRPTLNKLFALSGNKCAFPKCKEHIVSEDGTLVGEVCHIEAAEEGGERFNKESNDELRRSFDNLILLCRKHHKITNNVDIYTTEKLSEYKSTHELNFKETPFQIDTATLESIYTQVKSEYKKLSKVIEDSRDRILDSQISSKEAILKSISSLERLIRDPENSSEELSKQIENLLDECKEIVINGRAEEALQTVLRLQGVIKNSLIKEKTRSKYCYIKVFILSRLDMLEEVIEIGEDPDYISNEDIQIVLADIYLRLGLDKHFKIALKRINVNNPQAVTLKAAFRLYKSQRIKLESLDNEITPQIKAKRYYIYSQYSYIKGDSVNRDRYIEDCINLEPLNIQYRLKRFEYGIEDFLKALTPINSQNLVPTLNGFIEELDQLLNTVEGDDNIHRRLPILIDKLNILKLVLVNSPSSIDEIDTVTKQVRVHFYKKYFDRSMESYLDSMLDLPLPLLSKEMLEEWLAKILKSKKQPSISLCFKLVTISQSLNVDSNTISLFVEKYKLLSVSDLIKAIKSADSEKIALILNKLKPDLAHRLVTSIYDLNLVLEVLDNLTVLDEASKRKLKLLLLTDLDRKDLLGDLLKSIKIEEENLTICEAVAINARSIGQWSIEIKALKRMLELSTKSEQIKRLKGRLTKLYYYLNEYSKVIEYGESYLKIDPLYEDEEYQNILIMFIDSCRVENISMAKIVEYLHLYVDPIPENRKNTIIYFYEAEICIDNGDFHKALRLVSTATCKAKELDEHLIIGASNMLNEIYNKSGVSPDIKEYKISEYSFVKLENIENWVSINTEFSLDTKRFDIATDEAKSLIGHTKGELIMWPALKFTSNNQVRIIDTATNYEEYIGKRGAELVNKLSRQGDSGIYVFEHKSTEELIKMITNFFSWKDELLEKYTEGTLPFFILNSRINNISEVFSLVSQKEGAFVDIIKDSDDSNKQVKYLIEATNGKVTHIDSSSLFILFQCDLIEDIFKVLPNLKVPTQVLEVYRKLLEQNRRVGVNGSISMSTSRGNLNVYDTSQKDADKHFKYISERLDLINDKAKDVYGIAKEEKHPHPIEQSISSMVVDATLKAQEEDGVLLTEDISYAWYNSQITGKKLPGHFSSFIVVSYMYNLGLIKFEKYFKYLAYAISMHLHPILVTSQDLKKSIFTDETVLPLQPERLELLQLKFIWSPLYGTSFRYILDTIKNVLKDLILDSSIESTDISKVCDYLLPPILNYTNDLNLADLLVNKILGNLSAIELKDHSMAKKELVAKRIRDLL